MKISLYVLIGALIIGLVYIVVINTIAMGISGTDSNGNPNSSNTISSGSNIQIGMSDNIQVGVTRHRWYGTVYESNGQSYTRLLGYVRLPIESNGFPYWVIHLIMLFLIILIPAIVYIVEKLNSSDKNERGYETQCTEDLNSYSYS